MVIIGLGSLISSLASLMLMFAVGYAVITYGMAAYGAMVVAFHEPTPNDFLEPAYKVAAAYEADAYLKQIQKDTWEKKGLVALTQEDRNWVWASVRWQLLDGNYWSGYENKKVARIMDPYRPTGEGINKMVYYAGDNVYRVKTSMRVNLVAAGVDGKLWRDYAKPDYEYVVTVKCNPERKFWGRIRMNWEIVDVEYVGCNYEDDDLTSLTETTSCPVDKETAQKRAKVRAYKKQLQEQTVF